MVSKETGEDLRALAELVESGDVAPVVRRMFPLIEAADAIRYPSAATPQARSS